MLPYNMHLCNHGPRRLPQQQQQQQQQPPQQNNQPLPPSWYFCPPQPIAHHAAWCNGQHPAGTQVQLDTQHILAQFLSLFNAGQTACAGTSPTDRETLINAFKDGLKRGLDPRQILEGLDNVSYPEDLECVQR